MEASRTSRFSVTLLLLLLFILSASAARAPKANDHQAPAPAPQASDHQVRPFFTTAPAPSPQASAHQVSPFCRTAIYQPDEQSICTVLVNGAKTWADAMTNAIKVVIKVAKDVGKPLVNGLAEKLPHGLPPVTSKGIVSVCKLSVDEYLYYLEQCIGLVKDDPTEELKVYIGDVMFSDCKDAFDEEHIQNAEVDHFLNITLKFADVLYSILQTKPEY